MSTESPNWFVYVHPKGTKDTGDLEIVFMPNPVSYPWYKYLSNSNAFVAYSSAGEERLIDHLEMTNIFLGRK